MWAFLVVQMDLLQRIHLQCRRSGLIPGSGRSFAGGNAIHSSIFAWEIFEQRSLVGYSPRGRKESDTTEQLTHTHSHFILGVLSDL